jgi:hypothetical protein
MDDESRLLPGIESLEGSDSPIIKFLKISQEILERFFSLQGASLPCTIKKDFIKPPPRYS